MNSVQGSRHNLLKTTHSVILSLHHNQNYMTPQTYSTGWSIYRLAVQIFVLAHHLLLFSNMNRRELTKMLDRNTFLIHVEKTKAEFLPACVSNGATKPCFISAFGKNFH